MNETEQMIAICAGVVLARLFATSTSPQADVRIPLREVLSVPGGAFEPLATFGVDSLAWMQALTELETELNVEIGDDLLASESISAASIGAALSRALVRAGA